MDKQDYKDLLKIIIEINKYIMPFNKKANVILQLLQNIFNDAADKEQISAFKEFEERITLLYLEHLHLGEIYVMQFELQLISFIKRYAKNLMR